jgi:hypothetical protein
MPKIWLRLPVIIIHGTQAFILDRVGRMHPSRRAVVDVAKRTIHSHYRFLTKEKEKRRGRSVSIGSSIAHDAARTIRRGMEATESGGVACKEGSVFTALRLRAGFVFF